MAASEPNPLVVELARELKSTGTTETERVRNLSAEDLASEFAGERTPELVTYAGFLGGMVNARRTDWRLLYLDAKLLTWLLIDNTAIVHSHRDDDKKRFGQRDVVWVKAGASVSRGEGAVDDNDVEARFLRGQFTSAQDFTASLSGGTFSAPTGAVCEAMTPTCCGRRTR